MSPESKHRAVLELRDVHVIRDGRHIVDGVSLEISAGQRWIVLGANGSGKTTLVRVAAMQTHPSLGDVILGGRALGSFDLRAHRRRIAHASASLAAELRPGMTVAEAVMSAINGALETWWHDYDDADRSRTIEALATMNVAHLAGRSLGSLSSGEFQRVLLARALVVDPVIVLLDEPSARLDLGGREQLVALLEDLATTRPSLATVVVTHHVDEIPPSSTHCLMMRDGRAVSCGTIDDALNPAALTECFGLNLHLDRRPNGRYAAYAP